MKKFPITDARCLPAEAQEEKRRIAISLHEKGKSYPQIAEIVGVHKRTVGGWIRSYHEGGSQAIAGKPQGRPKRSGRALTAEQEARMQGALKDKTPDQLKLPFALWTRKSVQMIIKQELNIDIAISTVGKYLRSWGFTVQKPLKRAYEQNPKLVEKWLNEDYPVIAERAKKEHAEIHWGDETGLRNDCQHERGYAPKGKTPVIKLAVKRARLNIISTVTNQGKVRFMTYRGSMTASVLINFMNRLIKNTDKKVFLVLDNLRVHHAQKVKKWAEKKKDKIEIFYLPSYSPELNPDEYLNCDLKCGVHSGTPPITQEDLEKKTRSHMRMLQGKPERVKLYFKNRFIQYAA